MVYDKKTIFEEIIMAASPRTWLMSYTLFCFCTISFDLVSLSIYDNILTSVLDLFLPFCHSILPNCHLANIIKVSCLIFSPLFFGQCINVLISFFSRQISPVACLKDDISCSKCSESECLPEYI